VLRTSRLLFRYETRTTARRRMHKRRWASAQTGSRGTGAVSESISSLKKPAGSSRRLKL